MARTLYPVLLVLAIGTASLIWGFSGVGQIFGNSDPVSGIDAGDSIVDAKNDSAVGGGSFNGSAEGETSGGGIVGIIVSGIGFIVGFVAMVGNLPASLMQLGFPEYFAKPIGYLVVALVGLGVVQFATNRVYQ